MSDAADKPKPAVHNPDGRPLGPDGKPLPGPAQMQQIMAQKRMAQQQAQVDEVVGIMRNNVEKVLERDQKLSELDERADALQDGASQFEKQAGKLKNKFWLQNIKYIVIAGIIGLILLIILYFKFAGDDQPEPLYPKGAGGGEDLSKEVVREDSGLGPGNENITTEPPKNDKS